MSGSDDITVSPDEMAALMDSIEEGAETRTREIDEEGVRDVVRFDLVASKSVGRGQLPTFDLLNERLAGHLGDLLTRLTGQATNANVLPTETVKHVEIMGNLEEPTCLLLLELVGLRGMALMSFDVDLLFYIFDLLLGGQPGSSSSINPSEMIKRRGMTAVEKRLFGRVATMICDEMTSAWSAVFDVAFKPVRVATRPKQIAIYEPQELMVDTLFEFDVSGVEGKMHMMIPAASMRPVEKKLASGLLDSGASDGRSWSRQLTQLLCDVTVLCTAELGRASVTVRQLMDLKVGDILRLDRDPDSPITIFVEGLPRLQGTPTLEHGNIAIEVATVIEQSKPKEQTYKPPTPEMAPQAQENEDG